MGNLKERWGLKSNWEVLVILVVFTINGSLSGYLMKPILRFIGISKENLDWYLYWPIAIILVLPVYLILIVIIGSLFGQQKFFVNLVKKTVKHLGLGFLFKKEN
ncbi:MAG: diacylglyceryl transferase [Brumimicrobium sp.]|nr:diacylglyceryl transferase [Brumimicrobium sp.]MCO5268296.1 diacylglyceryl transferase [Brumimicrobium sp.]